jgi:hypothetical protein
MKISYAITVCNELEEIEKLIKFLHLNKRAEDEICVLLDKPKASDYLINQLYKYSSANWMFLKESVFQGHFADWKNELTKICNGDYIFQIDADEMITKVLIDNLPAILESNPDNEVFLIPRVNTVTGLTQEHITKWRWNVDEEDRVNWPDYQWRIWKKKPEIKWVNKVHERLEGFKTYAPIPAMPELALQHPKTIKRQEKQNEYYETL